MERLTFERHAWILWQNSNEMCALVRQQGVFQNEAGANKDTEEVIPMFRNSMVASSTGRTEKPFLSLPCFLCWDWWLPPVADENDVVEAHHWTRCWKIAFLCVLCFVFFFYFWWKSLFLLGTLARTVCTGFFALGK